MSEPTRWTPQWMVRLFRSNGANGLIDWLEVLNAPVRLTDPQHARSS